VLPFAVSICILSLCQGAIVALPAPRQLGPLRRLRSGWWALIPVASVIGFVFAVRAFSGVADGLAYLALIAVPPLAAFALGWAMRGARPWFALAAPALFALAWADRPGLAGEGAALLLDALSVVTLGVLLVAVTPPRLVKLAIVAMAIADAALVISNLLAAPNRVLAGVAPVAHLPQLQSVSFGSALMGYGDLFIAGLLGALVAAALPRQLRAAGLVAAIALLMDLLFFAVNQLPATVPIALALIVIELHERRARRRIAR
jgi:hypothetical protein